MPVFGEEPWIDDGLRRIRAAEAFFLQCQAQVIKLIYGIEEVFSR
jgi:hypothetical protein